MAWNKVGSLRKSQKGGLYIKFDKGVTVAANGSLMLSNPRESLDTAVANNKMSEEKAAEIKAKIPDYIKYDVFLVDEN